MAIRLHQIGVAHYGPKDSHESIECFLLAVDEEQVIAWLQENRITTWEDWESYGDEGEIWPRDEWWEKNPDAVARARTLGLDIVLCDWGDRKGQPKLAKGKKTALLRWWRGDFDDLSDLHYGATDYCWDKGEPVTSEECRLLLRLGVAQDARGFLPGSVESDG